MTSQQQITLDNLNQDVRTAQQNYSIEQSDYTNFRNGWNTAGQTPGGVVEGLTNEQWKSRMDASALSLATKLAKLNAANDALASFLSQVSQLDAAAFKASNPEVFQQVEAAKIAAQSEIIKNADSKQLMQGTTKYLIIGAIVLTVIVVGIYFLRKKFKG